MSTWHSRDTYTPNTVSFADIQRMGQDRMGQAWGTYFSLKKGGVIWCSTRTSPTLALFSWFIHALFSWFLNRVCSKHSSTEERGARCRTASLTQCPCVLQGNAHWKAAPRNLPPTLLSLRFQHRALQAKKTAPTRPSVQPLEFEETNAAGRNERHCWPETLGTYV